MSEQAIQYYARKLFPHLGGCYGRLAVIAMLQHRKKP